MIFDRIKPVRFNFLAFLALSNDYLAPEAAIPYTKIISNIIFSRCCSLQFFIISDSQKSIFPTEIRNFSENQGLHNNPLLFFPAHHRSKKYML